MDYEQIYRESLKDMNTTSITGCFSCLLTILIFAAVTLFLGWVLMSLWNWLIPIFWVAAPILTYWQATGIVLLISIIGKLLFG